MLLGQSWFSVVWGTGDFQHGVCAVFLNIALELHWGWKKAGGCRIQTEQDKGHGYAVLVINQYNWFSIRGLCTTVTTNNE